MLRAIHGDHVGNLIVTATITDGTPGLFRLSHVTGDRKYADCATRSGEWILKHLYLEGMDRKSNPNSKKIKEQIAAFAKDCPELHISIAD